jgi:pimeloyl-ACP methyl ester carboxylesterase
VQHYSGSTKEGTYYSYLSKSDAQENVLIFIHGVGMNLDVWNQQSKYFSRDFISVSYDFIGHGRSAMIKQNVTLEDYIEQLYELTSHLNINRFSLIGHSMGSVIGVAFALKYPKMVSSIVALNMVFNRQQEQRYIVLNRAEEVLSNNKVTNIEKTLNRWFKGKTSKTELESIEKIRKWLTKLQPIAYGQAYKIFALSDKIFINSLSKLEMPVMYLTGDNDLNSTPQMSIDMASITPKGIASSIKDEAHMMAYIAAEKVNPVIRKYLIGLTR